MNHLSTQINPRTRKKKGTLSSDTVDTNICGEKIMKNGNYSNNYFIISSVSITISMIT